MNKGVLYCIGLGVIIVVLFALNLLLGSVSIPAEDVMRILLGDESEKASWQFIILQSRLPQAITAMLCGAALAVSGLMLQTAFRNPLAGPSVFGINSGAGLGVALVMLLLGGSFHRGDGGDGGHLLFLHTGSQQCHVAHHRYHDRLHLQLGHLVAQLFRY